ncbi:hypothetical protein PROFUN_01493 [Planoprotostelium fungivorum]|uniref:C3H1-type domain-containing protein n=1 Tax=Planoprotostelium fungivorum TaxID=1890364 RepID=A0A2P6NTF9_9EUKA|nr:hypothetical protein PROFUN_01493 [Planoprotostelium fungivorum]
MARRAEQTQNSNAWFNPLSRPPPLRQNALASLNAPPPFHPSSVIVQEKPSIRSILTPPSPLHSTQQTDGPTHAHTLLQPPQPIHKMEPLRPLPVKGNDIKEKIDVQTQPGQFVARVEPVLERPELNPLVSDTRGSIPEGKTSSESIEEGQRETIKKSRKEERDENKEKVKRPKEERNTQERVQTGSKEAGKNNREEESHENHSKKGREKSHEEKADTSNEKVENRNKETERKEIRQEETRKEQPRVEEKKRIEKRDMNYVERRDEERVETSNKQVETSHKETMETNDLGREGPENRSTERGEEKGNQNKERKGGGEGHNKERSEGGSQKMEKKHILSKGTMIEYRTHVKRMIGAVIDQSKKTDKKTTKAEERKKKKKRNKENREQRKIEEMKIAAERERQVPEQREEAGKKRQREENQEKSWSHLLMGATPQGIILLEQSTIASQNQREVEEKETTRERERKRPKREEGEREGRREGRREEGKREEKREEGRREGKREGGKREERKEYKAPCTFWAQGRCRQGEQCLFSHSAPPLKKTEVCKFHRGGKCQRGDECIYSHDLKSVPCQYYQEGKCVSSVCAYGHFKVSPTTQSDSLVVSVTEEQLVNAVPGASQLPPQMLQNLIGFVNQKKVTDGVSTRPKELEIPFRPFSLGSTHAPSSLGSASSNTEGVMQNSFAFPAAVSVPTPSVSTGINFVDQERSSNNQKIPSQKQTDDDEADFDSAPTSSLYRYVRSLRQKLYGEQPLFHSFVLEFQFLQFNRVNEQYRYYAYLPSGILKNDNNSGIHIATSTAEFRTSNISGVVMISSDRLTVLIATFSGIDSLNNTLSFESTIGSIEGLLYFKGENGTVRFQGSFDVKGSVQGEGIEHLESMGTLSIVGDTTWDLKSVHASHFNLSRSTSFSNTGSTLIDTLNLNLDTPPSNWTEETILIKGRTIITQVELSGMFHCFGGSVTSIGLFTSFSYKQPNISLQAEATMDQREVHMRWNISENGNCGGFAPSEEFHLSLNDRMESVITSTNPTINGSRLESCQENRLVLSNSLTSAHYQNVSLPIRSQEVLVFLSPQLYNFHPNHTQMNITYGHSNNLTVSWSVPHNISYPCNATLQSVLLSLLTSSADQDSDPPALFNVSSSGSMFWNASVCTSSCLVSDVCQSCSSYSLSYRLLMHTSSGVEMYTAEKNTVPVIYADNYLYTSASPVEEIFTLQNEELYNLELKWRSGSPDCVCSEQLKDGWRMIYNDSVLLATHIYDSFTIGNLTIVTRCQYKNSQALNSTTQPLAYSFQAPFYQKKQSTGDDTNGGKLALIIFSVLLVLCILSAAGVLFYRYRTRRAQAESVPLMKGE